VYVQIVADSRMLQTVSLQGWAQGSFFEAEAEAESSRPRQCRLKTRQDQGSYWIWSFKRSHQSASVIKWVVNL